MGASDPEQAIFDKLAGPVGQWEPGGASPGGVQSGIAHGGNPEHADLSTVRFVKHRESARRHLYFVTFEGTHPRLGPQVRSFGYVYPVEPDPDGGWRVFGGAGGAGEPPRRSTPWVNLGGGGWPDRFFAGVALFITDETVEMPVTVALVDDASNEVAIHHAFPG